MNVRDALEADADALASIADSPTDVMRNLVHDRTVRVAEEPTHDPNTDTQRTQRGGPNPDNICGFVSFDATDNTVYVTQINGTQTACKRLLAEPVRFAQCEQMLVELLVPPERDDIKSAAKAVGFEHHGSGPRFAGEKTERFRHEP